MSKSSCRGLVSGLLMGFVYALIAAGLSLIFGLMEVLTAINRERGITVVFIGQNVEMALRMAHRACILESGRTILAGPSADLLASSEVKRIFLGH